MQSFIHNTASELYAAYGDEISSLRIMFPGRRARLFFNDALSSIAGKPIWQPDYVSVDDLMESIAGIERGDSIRLIAELYKVYAAYHDEPFDTFYFWGETLLADFDSVDKYMIDAPTLFVNIADLKDMESDLSFLATEQIAIIRKFWSNFNAASGDSPEKQHFAGIWNSLLNIYNDYRARLCQLGIAYQGMIYRTAAERLAAGDYDQELFSKNYAVVGFNALSISEQILFERMQRSRCAKFFWDGDTYYTENTAQEAGMFLRENMRRFPQAAPAAPSEFIKTKEIVVVAAPSDAMQCKYTATFLSGIASPGKETAVVLTDENLLLPVLHSIPASVENINITMGYPLKQTSAYTFIERLVGLQQRRKASSFYHSDVTGILNHPYIQAIAGSEAAKTAAEIVRLQQIYVPQSKFSGNPALETVFAAPEGRDATCSYLLAVISLVENSLKPADPDGMQREFFALAAENILKLQNTASACGVEITTPVFHSLLRKVLQSVRVPYEGEPLEGVQVMGMLETRNLDFENVLILSANDDTFPGNLSGAASFIPYNLRLAYGLPTPQHHEGVFGYYFYRLLQRARRIHIVYSTRTDEKKTGEPSRYIYQLDYESPHEVIRREITLNINFPARTLVPQPKTPEILASLEGFLGAGAVRKLSPSSLYTYVECPMKFYYQNILSLREEDEISEEVDLPMFGNIFHKAAEILYAPLIDKPLPEIIIASMINSSAVADAVDKAVESEYFKGSSSGDVGGNIIMIKEIVCKYLNECLLYYDSKNTGFEIAGVERWVDTMLDFETNGEKHSVRFAGKVDRVDVINGALRVVDYKTGSRRLEFRGIDSLFSEKFEERNPAALQTMLYSLLLAVETGREVVPSLYYIRFMNAADYSPLLVDVRGGDDSPRLERFEVHSFSDYETIFSEKLRGVLSELFDPAAAFVRCSDPRTCDYCAFREICF